ncbi:MAG: 3-deoxy-D-manno-octulosonic acid transferase [Halocynthiibacter sp.]
MAKSPGLSFFQALQRRQAAPSGSSRPDRPLVWLHATTETEASACRELIERLHEDRDEVRFLLTVMTPAAIVALEESRPPATEFAQLAGDDPAMVDDCRPDVVVWTKTASHPAILARARACGTPLILADAGIPSGHRSLLQRLAGVQRVLLSSFDKVLAGNVESARWLRTLALQAGTVEMLGEMQEGAVALPCNETERDSIARTLAARPVWLAVCCTNEEEPFVLAAHRAALKSAHRLLLILVPDDPAQKPGLGAALAERFEAAGFNAACRSQGGEPEEDVQVYIADTKDEMGLWYRLSPVSFLGRSLGPGDGINPYPAAALGSAVLHGPMVGRHAAGYSRLAAAGAAQLVRDAGELGAEVQRLQSPDKAAMMAHAAWQITSGGSQVIDRLAELLAEALDRQAKSAGGH